MSEMASLESHPELRLLWKRINGECLSPTVNAEDAFRLIIKDPDLGTFIISINGYIFKGEHDPENRISVEKAIEEFGSEFALAKAIGEAARQRLQEPIKIAEKRLQDLKNRLAYVEEDIRNFSRIHLS